MIKINRQEINKLLTMMLSAPNSQLCRSAHEKIMHSIESENIYLPEKIKSVLDDCAKFSLASEFVMETLDMAWHQSMDLAINEDPIFNLSEIKVNDYVSLHFSKDVSDLSLVPNIKYKVDTVSTEYIGIEDSDGFGLITTHVPVKLIKAHYTRLK